MSKQRLLGELILHSGGTEPIKIEDNALGIRDATTSRCREKGISVPNTDRLWSLSDSTSWQIVGGKEENQLVKGSHDHEMKDAGRTGCSHEVETSKRQLARTGPILLQQKLPERMSQNKLLVLAIASLEIKPFEQSSIKLNWNVNWMNKTYLQTTSRLKKLVTR